MSEWVRTALEQLTIDEKLTLLAGRDSWHTISNDRVGIPTLKVTDGPRGARGADGNHGPTSTSFPSGSAMGATWNPELIEQVGAALAHQTRAKGAHVLLGPTVNIPRIPNAGRNFECFSEDPLLSGTLAAAWVRGLQSEGVAACIKHFVCNDQEHDRYNVDAIVDERALREIYLEPFRIAIEESAPWAVMSAYNTINGTTASEHPLLDEVLRDEFGFDGLIMSDWFGTYGPGVMTSGLDLEMPGPGRWLSPESIRSGLDSGDVAPDDIDRKVERLLTLIDRTRASAWQDGTEVADERAEDRDLARRVATESLVLLTNDGLLPLDEPTRIAIIGEFAVDTPQQGGGSSTVNPHRLVSILDGMTAAAGPDVEVTWTPGCRVRRGAPPIDPHSLGGSGFDVDYFEGSEPIGDPVRSVTSTRSFLSFFGTGDEWVDYDEFAVRVSGRFVARVSGVHRFCFTAGGRLRVWIRGALAIDQWEGAGSDEVSADVDIAEGAELELEVAYASLPGERWRWLGIGCVPPGSEPSIEAAIAAAADADVAIVVAGLTPDFEAEGFDRPDLQLPGAQDELISAVAAAQANMAVILTAGAPVEMPWLGEVAAVLQAWYGGQEIGDAVADVLWGRADPGGRLPVTFPAHSRQHPGLEHYPGRDGEARYGESIHVGYRGFDEFGLEPLFPFGHGLTYTTFEAGITTCHQINDAVVLEIDVANTGGRPGVEVARVFGHDIGDISRRLVAFQKVELTESETRRLHIRIPIARLRYWDPSISTWRLPDGRLDLSVAGSFGTKRTSVVLDLDVSG